MNKMLQPGGRWARGAVVLTTIPAVIYLSPLTASTAAAAPAGNWLTEANVYRAIGGVPPVTENAAWQAGDTAHSQYMVENNVLTHAEDPANAWYTPAGDAEGKVSNVLIAPDQATTDVQAVDMWMSAPFHAMGVVDPLLNQAGFGSFRSARNGYQMGAAMDVVDGRGSVTAATRYPAMFPGSGSVVPLTRYPGGESPDPISSCAGYVAPAGLPIIVQYGRQTTVHVSAYAVSVNAQPMESCEIDAVNYTNPSAAWQQDGRSLLAQRGVVMIIPRQPLAMGDAYTVSLTVNGVVTSWSFTTGSTASGATGSPPPAGQAPPPPASHPASAPAVTSRPAPTRAPVGAASTPADVPSSQAMATASTALNTTAAAEPVAPAAPPVPAAAPALSVPVHAGATRPIPTSSQPAPHERLPMFLILSILVIFLAQQFVDPGGAGKIRTSAADPRQEGGDLEGLDPDQRRPNLRGD